MTKGIKSGYFLALTAVFLWSINVLIAQHFSSRLSPIEFAFGRWFFALLILLPLGLKRIKQHFFYFIRHFKWIIGLALSGIVLDNTLIYMASHTINAVDMSLLNLLGPIFLVILSALFLKQSLSVAQLGGMILTLTGVIFIITNGQIEHLAHMPFQIGNFWMILNAFCFAIYSYLQLRRPYFISQTALLTITVLTGVIILAPFFLLNNVEKIAHYGLTDYAIFLYLGIFNSVLAYLSWNTALIRLGTVRTGIIYYLQPLFSIIGAYFVLNTPITIAQVIGGCAVIIGVYIVSRLQKD